MKPLQHTTALVIMLLTCVQASVYAAEATLFSDQYFQGKRFTLKAGDIYNSLESLGWNNTVSSIKVDDGICVIGYEQTDFRRSYRLFGKGRHDALNNVGYNDEISSIIVANMNCRELRFSSFFTGPNFNGSEIMLPQGTRIPYWASHTAKSITSMRVFRGQSVCLYNSESWDKTQGVTEFTSGKYNQLSERTLPNSTASLIISTKKTCAL